MESLSRFIQAQDSFGVYKQAFSEICNGRKISHWTWCIFPQIKGVGNSNRAIYYGINDLQEAEEYLSDKTLGPRLHECCRALLAHKGKDIADIMGSKLDATKLRSSMTLFDAAEPKSIFNDVLVAFFNGEADTLTLDILSR